MALWRTRFKLHGRRLVDTSRSLLKWSAGVTAALIVIHGSASLGLFTGYNWYNNPQTASIDVFTHSLAGMSVALWILNLNLTRSRIVYWPLAIVASIVIGIGWEGFEQIAVTLNPNGVIHIFGFQDTIKDIWQDGLGGVIASFIADETVE